MARQILRGDKELQRALRGIPAIASTGLDSAVRDSLEPMRKQTSLNALRLRQPGNPPGGHLDQGVVVRKTSGRGKTIRTFWVSFTRRARYIAVLVEFGTAPHLIGSWMHPGATAKPFFTPAYESKKQETVSILGKKTWGLIERAALAFGRRTK